MTPASEIAFIKAQAPKAKYVMSVCGGSLILAHTGVLSGKRATTNKSFFKIVEVCLMGDLSIA
jgi:putative intracellular protease/amidase